MNTARVIYDTPGRNADLFYATRFNAPDPVIYIEARGKKYLVLSDLEIDRGKKESSVHKVLPLSKYNKIAEANKRDPRDISVILDLILTELKVKKILMPVGTGFLLVEKLRRKKYHIEAGPLPFYPERLIKKPDEVRKIEEAQRAVFAAMRMAEGILRKSSIRKNALYYKEKPLTSEWMREMIAIELLKRNCSVTDGSIVACGRDAVDPHNQGSGPLRPHEAIIIDIFPMSQETMYYGDATRTFCKGKAPKALKALYETVRAAQAYGLKNARAGISGQKVHKGILNLMERRGYKTGEKDGRMQGFFHSTGHGIGLELHEAPMRIGPVDFKLKAGHVFSVEPGLYYKGVGGVRIEDLVLVTKTGCRILSNYPKRLEVD